MWPLLYFGTLIVVEHEENHKYSNKESVLFIIVFL
jgi:hypothetical protein